MRIRFKTENGSIYEVDEIKRTWSRLNATAQSGPIRTDGGVMTNHLPIIVGKPALIICPPLERGDVRMITTSNVVEVEELNEYPTTEIRNS